jgi:hypothetical protein
VKVLLDEMLPAGVAGLLPGHDVTTVQQAAFSGSQRRSRHRHPGRAWVTMVYRLDSTVLAVRTLTNLYNERPTWLATAVATRRAGWQDIKG